MKEQVEKHFLPVAFYYTLIFALYTLIGRVTWFHGIVDGPFNAWAFRGFAGFGVLLLATDFFITKNYKKMAYYPVYLIFIAVAFISSMTNIKYGVGANLTTVTWLFVQMGLFTTLGQIMDKKMYDKWLTLFFIISSIMWAFSCIVSLYQFIYVKGYYIYMNDNFHRQSLIENRLFGIFIDPNLAAFVCLICIFGMMYFLKKYKNKWLRALFILQILIQTMYIILSGSRSVEVCIIVCFTYIGYYLLHKRFLQKERSLFVRGSLYVLLPILLSAVLLLSFDLIKTGSTYVASQLAPEIHQDKEELVRKDITGNESNNRTDIWKGYLFLMKDKPVFGISPRNAWEYADKVHPDSYLAGHHYDVHNAYVAVLACMGIVGFLALLLEMFCFGKTLLPRLFDTKTMDEQYFMAILFILVIAVFIFFYPGIYFTNGIDTLLFWPAIGYTMKDAKPLSFIKNNKI